MDTLSSGCLEPKWTSLRGMPGDSMGVLRDKHARLSLIARAYKVRLAQSNTHLPAAIPLPLPLDSEGVAQLNGQESDSRAKHPPPPQLAAPKSAADASLTCAAGLGSIPSRGPISSASLVAARPHSAELSKQQQRSAVDRAGFQHARLHKGVHPPLTSSTSVAVSDSSHAADVGQPGSGSFDEDGRAGLQGLFTTAPGQLELLHGMGREVGERSCAHASEGGCAFAAVDDMFLVRPVETGRPPFQPQPVDSREGNKEEAPLQLWQCMQEEPPCHAGLTFGEGRGPLPQSEGDECTGEKYLQVAAGPAAQGMPGHTAAAALPPPPPLPPAFGKQLLTSCLQQSGSGAQEQPPHVPYTRLPIRESSVAPVQAGVGTGDTVGVTDSRDAALQPRTGPPGDSASLASGDGDVMGSRSEAAAAELEAEAGEVFGQGEDDDDDVIFMGSAPGDPAVYGDWLQAQGPSQRHHGPATRRGGTQYPTSGRPSQLSKQRSILHFIQSRPSQQPIGSERGAGVASGVKRTGSGHRRSGSGLPHGQLFSQVLQPWVTTTTQPRSQQIAATVVASPVAQMQGPHTEETSVSTFPLLSRGQSKEALPQLDQGGAGEPAPVLTETLISSDVPPFRPIELQLQPPSHPLTLQRHESDLGGTETSKGCSGAVLPRRRSSSLFASTRAGSDRAAAATIATMTEPARNRLPYVASDEPTEDLSRVQPPPLPPLSRREVAAELYAELGPDRASRSHGVNEDDSTLAACQPVRGPSQVLRCSRVVAHSNGRKAHTPPTSRIATAASCPRSLQADPPVFPGEIPLADGVVRPACKKLQGSSLDVAPAAQAGAEMLTDPAGPSNVLVGSEAAAAGSLSMRALVDVATGVTDAPPPPCNGAVMEPLTVEGQYRYYNQVEQHQQQLNFVTPRCIQILRPQGDGLHLDHQVYGDNGNGGNGVFVPASHDDSTELLGTASEEYVVPATPMSLTGSEAAPPLSAPKSVSAAGSCRANATHAGITKGPGSAMWCGPSPQGDWTALRQHTWAIQGAAVVAATPLPANHMDSHEAVATAVASTPMGLASTRRDLGAAGELDSSLTTPVSSLLGPRGAGKAGVGGHPISAAFAGVAIPDVPATAVGVTDLVDSPRVEYYGRGQVNSGVGSHDELVHPGRVLQVQVAMDIWSSEDVLDQMQQLGSSKGGLKERDDTVAAHASGRACYVTCVVVKNTAPGAGLPLPGTQVGVRRNAMHWVNGADGAPGPVCCKAAYNDANNGRSGGRRQPLMLYTWQLPPDGPPVLHSKLALSIFQSKAPTAMVAAAATTAPHFCSGVPADLDAMCGQQDDAFTQLGYAFRLLVTADGGLSLVLSSTVDAPALLYSNEGGIAVSSGPQGLRDKFRDPHNSGKAFPEGQGDVPARTGPSLMDDLHRYQPRDGGDEAASGSIVGQVKLLRFHGGAWRLIRVLHGPAEILGGGGGPAVSDVATAVLRCLACTACSVLPSPPPSGGWGRDTEACPASSQTVQRMQSCWQIVAGGQAGRGCVWRLDPSLESVLHCEVLPSACCVTGQPGMASEVVELATLPHRPRLVLGAVADGCLALWDVGIACAVATPADGAIEGGPTQGPVSGHGAVATMLRLAPAVPAMLLTVVRPECCVLRCLQPVAVSVPGADQRTHEGSGAEVTVMETCGGRAGKNGEDKCDKPAFEVGSDNAASCAVCMEHPTDEFRPVSFLARACEVPVYAGSAGRAAVDGFGDEMCTAACVTPVLLSKDAVEVGRGLAAGVTCLSAWAGLAALGTEQGKVLAWDCKQGVLVAGWQLPAAVSAVAVNSRMVFAAAGGRLLLGRVA